MKDKLPSLIAQDLGARATLYRFFLTLKTRRETPQCSRAAYDYLKSISKRFGSQPRPNMAHPKLKGIVFQELPSSLKGYASAWAIDIDAIINLYVVLRDLKEPVCLQIIY